VVRRLVITVLAENTVIRGGLLAEHGLALWVEADNRRILFDTGQGMVLAHNAAKLGIDLSTADDVVLSHGHYDHTGGLLTALPAFSRATIYAHLAAFRDRFVSEPQGGARSVRSPVESLEWLASRVGHIFSTRANPVELSEGVWLTGQIPRHHDYEDTGGSFFLDESLTEPDAIIDDQALYVKTGNGIVV